MERMLNAEMTEMAAAVTGPRAGYAAAAAISSSNGCWLDLQTKPVTQDFHRFRRPRRSRS
jgi:hypothetical protein